MSFLKKTKQKREAIYRDFRKDFLLNPISNDLAVITDEQAIKESFKNLILTDKGERLFRPTLGSNVRATLFENNTPATIKLLEENIRDVINNFEPRAGIIDVNLYSVEEQNGISVTIRFYMINRESPIEVNLFLERTR